MKSNLKAFPYPVLGNVDDFVDSEFQSTVELRKINKEGEDSVALDYSFLLSNPEIDDLIQSGAAKFAIDVECPDTLYRKVFSCDVRGTIEFLPGELFGKVTFYSLVVVTRSVDNFTAEDLNEEYRGVTFGLSTGDVIAYDDPQSRFIEFDKLRFESLVKVQTSEELAEDTYIFDMSGDVLVILMGTRFRRFWDQNREEKSMAPLLAMSVYKDCILAALDAIVRDYDDATQYKWARALMLKLNTLGKTLGPDADFNELNSNAQQLIAKIGIQRLVKNV
jgi:hypothetical protein